MDAHNNFCTWPDANHFMLVCNQFANGIPGMIEKAQVLDSPLEAVMLAALMAADKAISHYPESSAEMLRIMRNEGVLKLDVRAAVPVGAYRADLVMSAQLRPGEAQQPAKVVIECDGHMYHERTRAQAMHDRQRDRYMQREGFIVARFTGDEIIRSPFECAFEVYDLVLRDFARVDRGAHPPSGWPVFTRGHPGRHIRALGVAEFIALADLKSHPSVAGVV